MRKVPIPRGQRAADFIHGPLVVIVWLAAAGTASWLVARRSAPIDHIGWVPPVEFEVTAPITGTLGAVLVEPMQRVQRGELLAQLDPRPVQARLATARAQVDELSVRAEVAGEIARGESAHLAAELEREIEAETRRWTADHRRYLLDEVELTLDALEVQVELAEDRVAADLLVVRLRRARRLAEQGIGPLSDVEDLDLRKQRAEARIAANEALLARQRQELDTAQARRATFQLQTPPSTQLIPVPDEIRALQAAVRVQVLRVEELELEREGLALSAPIDGQVTALFVGEGQAVLAGSPVLSVTRERATQAVVFVDPSMGADELVGRRVALRGRDRSTPVLESRVASVGPKVELLPERLWPSPTLPAYGRALVVPLPDTGPFVPGEVLGVRVLAD